MKQIQAQLWLQLVWGEEVLVIIQSTSLIIKGACNQFYAMNNLMA